MSGPKNKPDPPYDGFPLYSHRNGQWAKKIRGKTHFFGTWPEPYKALEKYMQEREALHAGLEPHRSAPAGGITVREVLNGFLEAHQLRKDSGELGTRQFDDYHSTCTRLSRAFDLDRPVADLGPDDFTAYYGTLAKRYGLTTLGNEIQRVRTVFGYAWSNDWLDRPMKFGPIFRKPNRQTMRRMKAQKVPNLFTADEIRAIMAAASPGTKAMVLLGVNCGFGNTDCLALQKRSIDLESGWINHPRPKTGVGRRCPLWPETMATIKEYLMVRPKVESDKLFVAAKLQSEWSEKWGAASISTKFRRLLQKLFTKASDDSRRLAGGGFGFYTFRHTFATVAAGAKDRPAVKAIMGHIENDVLSNYEEAHVDDRRLRDVAEYVRRWLFVD